MGTSEFGMQLERAEKCCQSPVSISLGLERLRRRSCTTRPAWPVFSTGVRRRASPRRILPSSPGQSRPRPRPTRCIADVLPNVGEQPCALHITRIQSGHGLAVNGSFFGLIDGIRRRLARPVAGRRWQWHSIRPGPMGLAGGRADEPSPRSPVPQPAGTHKAHSNPKLNDTAWNDTD